MPVQSLVTAKNKKKQQYSVRQLFNLVFTDYAGLPSELTKIPNIELYAKQQVGQIINQAGLQPVSVVTQFFGIVNEIQQQIALSGIITEQQIQDIVDSAGTAAVDTFVTTFGVGG